MDSRNDYDSLLPNGTKTARANKKTIDMVIDLINERIGGYVNEMKSQGNEWTQPDYLATKVNELTSLITQIKDLLPIKQRL